MSFARLRSGTSNCSAHVRSSSNFQNLDTFFRLLLDRVGQTDSQQWLCISVTRSLPMMEPFLRPKEGQCRYDADYLAHTDLERCRSADVTLAAFFDFW
jgi:hypothetical protein